MGNCLPQTALKITDPWAAGAIRSLSRMDPPERGRPFSGSRALRCIEVQDSLQIENLI